MTNWDQLHQDLQKAIEDLAEKNRDAPIIVEGEYDRRALRALGILGRRRVAVGEAVFVAVAGDVLELLLCQLETLGLSLAALDQRLLGGVVGVMRHLQKPGSPLPLPCNSAVRTP